MKLIKLELLNLASLDRAGGEVINFEEGVLGESTIFSIVGPTGSGKSTLLDAICLALYNRAPRYPRKKKDKDRMEILGTPDEGEKNRLSPRDCRNILTRGKKEGFSKLTFLANNGNVYRAEWYVKFKTCVFRTFAVGHLTHLKIIVIIVIIEHHTVLVLLTEVPGPRRQDAQHKQTNNSKPFHN